jgi:hypothetical protein
MSITEPTAADYADFTAEQSQLADQAETGAGAESEESNPNREAAGYRRRLRDTESERDTLSAQVERLQRAEAIRLAEGRLSVPGDLFAFGAELADLLTEDGDVSPDAVTVTVTVAKLIAERPGLGRVAKPPFPDLGQGVRGQ